MSNPMPEPQPHTPPVGTTIFLFTDIQSSTSLWQHYRNSMPAALARHRTLLETAIRENGGYVFQIVGDALCAAFTTAGAALAAAAAGQRALLAEKWQDIEPLQARMGIHAGPAEVDEADLLAGQYASSLTLSRAARLMGAAHGGQVLVSAAVEALARDYLPPGVGLRDLGIHRLRDVVLPERIFQLTAPGLPDVFPPIHAAVVAPINLPAQPTPLIGRRAELSEITARLRSDEARLLTLTGPGGIGKTRLALQAAEALVDAFGDGIYFVDLAPVRDPASVLVAIARAVGLKETSEQPLLDDLKNQLRDKRMLLLLDNFEQVISGAPRVAELLRDSRQLRVLVTSREALRVSGEHVFPIPPLGLPAAGLAHPSLEQLTQYEAVQLFIERALAVKPGFQVTNENAPAVAEICVRLDGLPLAIELAAARISLFSPQALLERLGSRLTLLRGGARDLPVRQQTLRGAIDWSYELLSAGEQRLFEVLSVFAGGISLDAVEGVAGGLQRLREMDVDMLDGLASLVDKSLIRQANQPAGESRLVMLHTIREYASERLETDPEFSAAARRAHALYFAGFAERQWQRLGGREREAALSTLASEIENLRTAWRYWVEAQDLDQLGRMVDGLWRLDDARGWYHATVDLSADLLDVLSSTPSTPERLQQEIILQTSLARARLAIEGYTAGVEAAYRRALELSQGAGDVPELYPVLRGLASLYTYLGQFGKAAQMGQRILSLAERLNDASMLAEGHLVLGYNSGFENSLGPAMKELESAMAGFDSALATTRRFQLGTNPAVVARNVSALLLWLQGFPDRALARANEAVSLAAKLDHPFSMAYALFHCGMLHLWRREPEAALERAVAVLEVAEKHEFEVWRAVAACVHGVALAETGRAEEGLVEMRAGLASYQGLHTPPVFWPLLLQFQATAYARVGRPDQGLAVLDEAMGLIPPEAGHMLVADFYRHKGDLLAEMSPARSGEAESWYRRAVGAAQDLRLGMLELRAAIALCRLRPDPETRQILSAAYAKFSEGFTTPDLQDARELLAMPAPG